MTHSQVCDDASTGEGRGLVGSIVWHIVKDPAMVEGEIQVEKCFSVLHFNVSVCTDMDIMESLKEC